MSEQSPANRDNPISNNSPTSKTILSNFDPEGDDINVTRTVKAERIIGNRDKIERNESIAQRNIDTANALIEKVSEQVGNAAGKDLRAALQQKLIDTTRNKIAQRKAFQAREFIEKDLNRIANALYEASLRENDRLVAIDVDVIKPVTSSNFQLKLSRPPRTSSMNELLGEKMFAKPISEPDKFNSSDN